MDSNGDGGRSGRSEEEFRQELGIDPDIYPELAAGCRVPHGPLGRIKLAFAREFGPWKISLPEEAVVARAQGKICVLGWAIWYRFGTDEEGEFLDYYSSHRMTSDSHVRIHEDGREESLEILSTARLVSEDPVEDAELEKAFRAKNQRINQKLAEKGFALTGEEPLAVILNRLLVTGELSEEGEDG